MKICKMIRTIFLGVLTEINLQDFLSIDDKKENLLGAKEHETPFN